MHSRKFVQSGHPGEGTKINYVNNLRPVFKAHLQAGLRGRIEASLHKKIELGTLARPEFA
jgi:hypothetical protein